ncbi:MAG: hypothetical protein M3020_04420 [Myxococcota bacterium]|nr:hypothetical protein [Myxococcota bacterium]
MSTDKRLAAMRRAANRAGRRLRYRALLDRVRLLLPLPIGFAALALAAIKLARLGADSQTPLIYATAALGVLVLAACAAAWFRSPPRWAGALLLDRHHQLDGRLATALELAEDKEPSTLAGLAIEDGIARAGKLDPRRAVPVPLPRDLWVSVALAALVFGISSIELRTVRVVPPPKTFDPLVMARDDLELFGAMADELAKKAEDPKSLAAIRRFNGLIEDIAARRLDRKEALARLGELEAELDKSLDADHEARKLGLEGLARELSRSGLTKAAADALQEERLKDAEKAVRELAERLKRKDRKPTKAEIEKLHQALQRAGKVSAERKASLEQRAKELAEERESLLKKHKGDQKALARDAKAQENSRKLERLNRDRQKADAAAKEISDLDRELAEAAEQLKQDMGKGAESLEQAAEGLNQMARRQMSEQEKRELLQRLRDLREVVRRQGQGGDDRKKQMEEFAKRARGQKGQGKDGEGQGQGQGKGKRGKGQPGGQGSMELVEVPRIVEVPGSGSGKPGEGGSDQPGSGKQAGAGHDDATRGDPSKLDAETHDVAAAGIDTGEGTASAEVISGAAERGFVGKGYRDVFVQYENVAEEALEKDDIPPGYRFYVRRYFQLIRPRD